MNERTGVIVGVIAVPLGAAGLIVGISAKNGNQSDADIADEISKQTAGTSETATGAEKAANKDLAEEKKTSSAESSPATELA